MSGLGGNSEGLFGCLGWPAFAAEDVRSRTRKLFLESLEGGAEWEADVMRGSGLGLWRPAVGVT